VFFSLNYGFLFLFLTWPSRPFFLRVHLEFYFVSYTIYSYIYYQLERIKKVIGSVGREGWLFLKFILKNSFEKVCVKKKKLQRPKKYVIPKRKFENNPAPWYAKCTLLQSLRSVVSFSKRGCFLNRTLMSSSTFLRGDWSFEVFLELLDRAPKNGHSAILNEMEWV
jgi:hypothetical protein